MTMEADNEYIFNPQRTFMEGYSGQGPKIICYTVTGPALIEMLQLLSQ